MFFDLGRRAAAAERFPAVKVQVSPDPKSEVARGLLEDNPRNECLNVHREDEQKLKINTLQGDYSSLFMRFASEYKRVFKNLYPLPDLDKNSAKDLLNRYAGNRESLINVFMQVLYKRWAAGDSVGG